MAISRTPKKQERNEQMFEIPIAQVFEDVDNEDNSSEKEEDDRFKSLEDRLVDMQNRLSEAERTNMALASQPSPWRSQVQEITEVKPESIELPDPALDPNGYDAAVSKRMEIRLANDRRRQERDNQQKQDVQDKTDSLWAAFAEKYPDMSEDRERIDFVATSVVQAAMKRGVDPQRYMFVTQDKFLEDVAKKYAKVFGEPEVEDDDFEDNSRRRSRQVDPAPRSRARARNRQEEDDNRTGGIFGGNESGGRPARQRDRDDEAGPSMIDDIQKMQRNSGFF